MTGPSRGAAAGGDVATAAADWLAGLAADQRARARFAMTDDERFDWHYVPRSRDGLPLAEMSADQRHAAFEVLRAGLGDPGFRKARQIIDLEVILGEIERSGGWRDPDKYFLTVFGTPGPSGDWGWRFEGHHLSLNMAYRDGRLVAATPCFLGANPAIVPIAPHRGLEVLKDEIGAARAVLETLDAAERERAIIAGRSFGDIVAGPGREDRLRTPEGLPAGDMDAGQREALVRLLDVYLATLPAGDAAAERDRIRVAALDAVHFAWAGATEPGEAHYFRVHGPVTLIEYDNTRNDANHVHSVWHDPTNPFGRDVLGAHYRTGHTHRPA